MNLEKIQKEAFRSTTKNITCFIRDARTLGIPDYKISTALKRLKNDQLSWIF